jgi:tetratricopeptide (TPR) repeat protein
MKYLLVLLLVLPLNLYARKQGQSLIDSLKNELPKAITDTNKVKLLDNLAYNYANVAPDSGIYFGQQALALAGKLQWKKGMAMAHNDIGVNYEAKTDHANALNHYNKAMVLYDELGIKTGSSGVFTNIAVVYSEQGDYNSAIAYFFKALKIYDAAHEDGRKAMILENIGLVYMEQQLYEKAIDYYGEALALYHKTGDKQNEGTTLENIGTLLNNTGKYDKALEKYSEALKIHTDIGNKKSIENTLLSMGDTYTKIKDYAKALDCLQRSLAISREIGRKSSIAIATGNMGETWFRMATDNHKNPDKDALKNAIGYLSDAVEQCRSLNFIPPMLEFEEYLSQAYSLAGQYKQAYELGKQYHTLKDSIFSVETKMQLASLESKRQMDLKDKDLALEKNKLKLKELELAKKHNDQLLFVACLILMLMATAIAVRLYFKYKRSNRTLQKEKKEHLNRIREHVERIKEQSALLDEISHMQAHDVRGSVATILGLVHIFNSKDYSDPSNKMVIDGINVVAHKLDNTIQEIIKKENSLG